MGLFGKVKKGLKKAVKTATKDAYDVTFGVAAETASMGLKDATKLAQQNPALANVAGAYMGMPGVGDMLSGAPVSNNYVSPTIDYKKYLPIAIVVFGLILVISIIKR